MADEDPNNGKTFPEVFGKMLGNAYTGWVKDQQHAPVDPVEMTVADTMWDIVRNKMPRDVDISTPKAKDAYVKKVAELAKSAFSSADSNHDGIITSAEVKDSWPNLKSFCQVPFKNNGDMPINDIEVRIKTEAEALRQRLDGLGKKVVDRAVAVDANLVPSSNYRIHTEAGNIGK